MSKAWYILIAKTDGCDLSLCNNHPTLIQRSPPLSCCVLTGGWPLHQNTPIRQKPAKLLASVGQTDIHTGRFSFELTNVS